jgi:glycolate oxidase FAD binding subunit
MLNDERGISFGKRRRLMATAEQFLPLTETVAPADQAAVGEAVRRACQGNTPIYPIGGGTRLDYGARPTRPGMALSRAGLDGVIDHAADDMTITVEAGVRVAELARRLAAERQRLPVDVARADRATIGGVVATGPSGPRRYAHGTIREYVIGMRVVDGLGNAFSGGGRVVKNAAGYNLCRLMVGSLGTLGVITQVTLMARPMPEASALVVCEVEDLDGAERLLAQLVETRTLPAAIELQAGAARQGNPVLGPRLESSAARLLVGFEGSRSEVDWMVGRLHREWGEWGVQSPLAVDGSQADLLWDWLAAFSAHVQIGVRPGATVEMIRRLLELDPGCSIQAHAGNGVIRAALSLLPPAEFTALLRGRIRPAAAAAGGKMVVLRYPQEAPLTCRDVWGPPGDGAAVSRAIKDRFDPKGLLNPGRFAYED